MDNWAGNRDGYLKKQIRSDFNRYISTSGQMTLLLYTERPADRSFHDYISVTVSRINDPPDAPTIDGPTSGEPQVEYDFTFVTSDPEEDDIWYKIDWGDGNVTDWIGPYENEQVITRSHSWSENGIYQIKAKAKDSQTESPWSNPHPIKIGNYAPDAPTIDGPPSGKPGKEYEFTLNSTDPDGDDIKYFIDWGDNTTDETGFNASGTDVKVKHTWSERGDYTIKAKAIDVNDAESELSTLEITMPKNKAFNFYHNLLNRLFERFPNVFTILRYILGL